MQQVKLNALEKSFKKEIEFARKNEIKNNQKMSLFKSLNIILVTFVPPLISLLIFSI